MWEEATPGQVYSVTARFVVMSPPKSVSIPAISGFVTSRLTIISAFARISANRESPRSGCPTLDAVVPAPVWRNAVNYQRIIVAMTI
jgi:hypothetical protein